MEENKLYEETIGMEFPIDNVCPVYLRITLPNITLPTDILHYINIKKIENSSSLKSYYFELKKLKIQENEPNIKLDEIDLRISAKWSKLMTFQKNIPKFYDICFKFQ